MKISNKLRLAITELYDAGLWGISHVGQANYAERQREANDHFYQAWFKVHSMIGNDDET